MHIAAEDNQVLFEIPVEMELVKSDNGGRRIIRGYASTESMDQDGEIILQSGIDFSPLLKSGYLNYDHYGKCLSCGTVYDRGTCPKCQSKTRMPMIIGVPTHASIRDKGLWVEGELFKGDAATSDQMRFADEMWEMGMALQKSGQRSLCYSVEGGIIARDPSNPKKISKSIVRHLAVTHKPVNPDATVELFAKSLCCGRCNPDHPLHVPGHVCGSHAPISKEDVEDITKALTTTAGEGQGAGSTSPLALENLDRGLSGIIYGDCSNGCWDGTGKFKNGIPGAVEHLQKCRGYSHGQSIQLLQKAIRGAQMHPSLNALVTQAGLVRTNPV